MANCTSLAHCFMLVHKRAALLCVTLKAGFVWAEERKSAAFECLLNIRRRAFKGDPLVRVVTITAAHFPFGHRMMMRQLELRANVQVTLKARFGGLSWIDNRPRSAPGLDVQTPRPVARLAAHVSGVFAFCLQSRVSGCPEIAHDLFVACRAFLRANKLPARDVGRRKDRSASRAAGK